MTTDSAVLNVPGHSQSLPKPPKTRRPPFTAVAREVLGSRSMIRNLVGRDLKVRHRGTVLGMLWSLATPMATLATYSVVFTVVFKARLTNVSYPFVLYLFAGLVVWNFFAGALNTAASSVTSASYLLRKLYFPRLILPLVSVLATFVTFTYEFLVFFIVSLAFQEWPRATYLVAPYIVICVALMAFGIGMILASLTVFLRDIPHFVGIGLQLWFFGTPIVFATTQFSPDSKFLRLMRFNPMYHSITAFRDAVLNHRMPTTENLLVPLACGIVFCVIGYQIYQRTQRRFAELV